MSSVKFACYLCNDDSRKFDLTELRIHLSKHHFGNFAKFDCPECGQRSFSLTDSLTHVNSCGLKRENIYSTEDLSKWGRLIEAEHESIKLTSIRVMKSNEADKDRAVLSGLGSKEKKKPSSSCLKYLCGRCKSDTPQHSLEDLRVHLSMTHFGNSGKFNCPKCRHVAYHLSDSLGHIEKCGIKRRDIYCSIDLPKMKDLEEAERRSIQKTIISLSRNASSKRKTVSDQKVIKPTVRRDANNNNKESLLMGRTAAGADDKSFSDNSMTTKLMDKKEKSLGVPLKPVSFVYKHKIPEDDDSEEEEIIHLGPRGLDQIAQRMGRSLGSTRDYTVKEDNSVPSEPSDNVPKSPEPPRSPDEKLEYGQTRVIPQERVQVPTEVPRSGPSNKTEEVLMKTLFADFHRNEAGRNRSNSPELPDFNRPRFHVKARRMKSSGLLYSEGKVSEREKARRAMSPELWKSEEKWRISTKDKKVIKRKEPMEQDDSYLAKRRLNSSTKTSDLREASSVPVPFPKTRVGKYICVRAAETLKPRPHAVVMPILKLFLKPGPIHDDDLLTDTEDELPSERSIGNVHYL